MLWQCSGLPEHMTQGLSYTGLWPLLSIEFIGWTSRNSKVVHRLSDSGFVVPPFYRQVFPGSRDPCLGGWEASNVCLMRDCALGCQFTNCWESGV